ncbi:unnamed protein product [Rangifer tarandus platyrhynchus]|uniref:Uncharacterized protein n=2 Tax=Rangifer tarandus platyrhynchus TaxID=3082113 RepID=A0ACB0F6A8_RANTA|nr:unnamed protein product [Rangifer tarandus platyrhynchus]CAI9708373.1 unnamed protein product [Rangifer tarandus platyrhynchus]
MTCGQQVGAGQRPRGQEDRAQGKPSGLEASPPPSLPPAVSVEGRLGHVVRSGDPHAQGRSAGRGCGGMRWFA